MPARPVGRGRQPWNKGLLVGQKKPLEPKHVWSIRVRLEIARSKRDLAIFNLAIDSKLRGCDLVKLRLLVATSRGQSWRRRFAVPSQGCFSTAYRSACEKNDRIAGVDHLSASLCSWDTSGFT